ncbi:DUF2953 domain-containing protein [Bacillus sp. V5-8f]|uniref:DUF2953 domain-containing protein n=1 Tax=Bacillus sp. V5-8f TaxID=2053044 RepID=UPI0015E0F4C7|nr:DUF2953 domain-containing protein [Bacillus sp. V5-8f]
MVWALGIIGIVLALILLLMFTRMKIIVHYHHQPPDPDVFYIQFRAGFGILQYTMNVPSNKKNRNPSKRTDTGSFGSKNDLEKASNKANFLEEAINGLHQPGQLINQVSAFSRPLKKIIHKVKVRKLEWHSLAGAGDASYTGTMAGGFLAVKGAIIGMLYEFLLFKRQPIFSVTPDFARAVFSTSITCIFQLRIGEAILAAIKLLRYLNTQNIKTNTNEYKRSEEQSI